MLPYTRTVAQSRHTYLKKLIKLGKGSLLDFGLLIHKLGFILVVWVLSCVYFDTLEKGFTYSFYSNIDEVNTQ